MPTYILVQWHPKGTTKASETRLLLYHGTQAQELHERGVDTLPVAQWALNAVDWTELEPPDNNKRPYMAQRAAVSAINRDLYQPTAYGISSNDGNQERALGRPRAGCERRVFGSGRPDAWAMARGARIGATTRCSDWHGSRCMEIAKCLILKESLFPVIVITGISGSLLAVLVPK
jgi:hypothetical protein